MFYMDRGDKGIRLHLTKNPDIKNIEFFLTYQCNLYLGDEWLSEPEDKTLFRLDLSKKQVYSVSFNNGFIEFKYLGDNNGDMKEIAKRLYSKYVYNFKQVTNLDNKIIELN